jgi:hypothetical protein
MINRILLVFVQEFQSGAVVDTHPIQQAGGEP